MVTSDSSVLNPDLTLSRETRDVAAPGPGEVLVRIKSVGVCGSDVHYYKHGRIGDFVVTQPMILGHESSGVIEAVGDGVDPARVGERVSLEPGVPCLGSPETLAGKYNLDPDVRFFATPPYDGTFCENVVHPASFCYPVPDGLSDDAAALLEPLSVAIAANEAGQTGLGARVLIAGAGPVGLLCAQVARLAGATTVTLTDVRAERLEVAASYGATETVVAGQPLGDGYTVFIDASGAEPAVLAGLRALAPAGRAVLVGMGADTVALPVPLVQGRELVITGTFRYRNTWPRAIAIAPQVNLDGLVTSRHGLDDIAGALDAAVAPGALKAVVTP
ncbi:NAD(P)-dependent alcohol dehydrogenase [Micrococcales bacterium 31B]|nr:NAD(P)-dependent alcohol dehydrogenase [Micrococcales bacterium 31B]